MKTHIRLTRREAIEMLGVGAAAAILPAVISAAKSPAFKEPGLSEGRRDPDDFDGSSTFDPGREGDFVS